jgi:6-phosphogluconolactonase (cycloisomerase 2 family)
MNTTQGSGRAVSAYAAVGARLINLILDAEAGTLTRGGEITLPSRVQYVWPHPDKPVIYAACADRSEGAAGQSFHLCALRRDDKGELSMHGDTAMLPSRPIHVTADIPGRRVLTAFSGAPGLTMHELKEDGTLGAEIPRAAGFDAGSNPHQVRVTPSNERAILVARGKKGSGPSYVEGGLKVLRFDGGRLENLHTVAPEPAESPGGFNPRHIDFHPTRPWVFVSLEAQNRLMVYRLNGAELDPRPLFARDFLADPGNVRKRQDGGTVHVHPNGKFVYVANRNDGYVNGHGPSWITPDPVPVFPGGENNIAVFRINEETGEPTLIQHADSRGLHPRCFALDPTGRVMVAANLAPTVMREGDALREIPANLALFRVGDDGRLDFLRRYDVDVGREMIWWMGVVG